MTSRPAPPTTAPAATTVRTWWSGDPSIIVFAVRYALGRRGCHGPQLVGQAIAANAHNLPEPARRAIASDVEDWLDDEGDHAPEADRALWSAVLERVASHATSRAARKRASR
jgi:hypothetical protein